MKKEETNKTIYMYSVMCAGKTITFFKQTIDWKQNKKKMMRKLNRKT